MAPQQILVRKTNRNWKVGSIDWNVFFAPSPHKRIVLWWWFMEFHGSLWVPWVPGIPWKSMDDMEFHGCHGISWNYMQSVEFHGIYENTWNFIDSVGTFWMTCVTWNSMYFHSFHGTPSSARGHRCHPEGHMVSSKSSCGVIQEV